MKLNWNEWTDPKELEAYQRPQPLKVTLELGGKTSSGYLFEEAGGGSETDVYQRRHCRMVEGHDLTWRVSSAVRGEFYHPE